MINKLNKQQYTKCIVVTISSAGANNTKYGIDSSDLYSNKKVWPY